VHNFAGALAAANFSFFMATFQAGCRSFTVLGLNRIATRSFFGISQAKLASLFARFVLINVNVVNVRVVKSRRHIDNIRVID